MASPLSSKLDQIVDDDLTTSDQANGSDAGDQDQGNGSEAAGDLVHEEDQQDQSLNPNPFVDPVILRTLFEVCDLRDLRRFRLVSEQWRDLSLPRWRREMLVKCRYDGDHDDNTSSDDGEDEDWEQGLTEDIINALYTTRSRIRRPFNKYELKSWNFSSYTLGYLDGLQVAPPPPTSTAEEDPEEEVEDEEEPFPGVDKRIVGMRKCALLWRNCGSWMTHLSLEEPRLHSIQLFYKVIFEMTPNLKELNVKRPILTEAAAFAVGRHRMEEEEPQVSHVNGNLKTLRIEFEEDNTTLFWWKELFLHFPNVETLELGGNAVPVLEVVKLVQDLEELCTTKEHKLKVKNLDLSMCSSHMCHPPENVTNRLLALMPSPLDSLNFDVCNDDDNAFEGAIQRFGDGLKKLTVANVVHCRDDDPPVYRSFPFAITLSNLTYLELHSNLVDSLGFLLYTPSLEVLKIAGASERSKLGIGRMITPKTLKKLSELVLPYCHKLQLVGSAPFYLDRERVKCLAKCMPNLRSLYATVSTKGFRAICRHWKGLRKLAIHAKELDDGGFTGISIDSRTSSNSVNNITNLKELRKCFVYETELSDTSIYEGFLKLSYLTEVTVALSKKTSDEAYKALRNSVPISNVYRDKEDDDED